MKLVKCGREKLEDNFCNITLSDYAVAIVEGTKEELSKFESYMMDKGWGELGIEPEEVELNKKGIMIYSDMYSFDIEEIRDFKEDYKLFKKQ